MLMTKNIDLEKKRRKSIVQKELLWGMLASPSLIGFNPVPLCKGSKGRVLTCEIFSKAIAITFRWIRENFRFWFLIVRDSEFIIRLRHVRRFRSRFDEREIDDRDKKRWVLEIIVVIIRFDRRWSKFCRIARKFNNHWFIVYIQKFKRISSWFWLIIISFAIHKNVRI